MRLEMKQTKIAGLALYFLITIAIIPGYIVADNPPSAEQTPFIDLDGDGFDDNAADNNENGIPDMCEKKNNEPVEEVSSILGNVFDTGEIAAVSIDEFLPKSEVFSKLKFSCRSISSHRCGFNSAQSFGASFGLGLGTGSAGCVGPGCVAKIWSR
jgi:hypothetical protein